MFCVFFFTLSYETYRSYFLIANVTTQYLIVRPIFAFSTDTNRHEQTTYFSNYSIRIQVSGIIEIVKLAPLAQQNSVIFLLTY